MEDPEATVPAPRNPNPGVTDSQMAALMAAGADAFATRPASSSARGWQPPSVESLQSALPQYEITALIARGGMGAVYKGSQKTLRRPVAIKILPPEMEEYTGDLQFAARFKQEAQAMARLSHPNIVTVFDAGEVVLGARSSDPRPTSGVDAPGHSDAPGSALLYFVMEFVEGTDVAQLIASEGRLEAARAIQIISAVCDALAFAHEEGIVHRDIKPSNIMIDRKGRVKVADFGLAKAVNMESTLMTRSDVAMGTPDFVAPEAMIPGMKVDGRADLYAAGVMLYQMLTGTIPRGRFQLPSGLIPQIDPRLDAIVDKAMQTDRDHRYSTALEMKTDVERVGAAAPVAAPARARTGDAPPTDHRLATAATAATIKSRKPLLLGIAAAAVIVSTAAFFLMDKGKDAEGGADGSASAAKANEPWVNALTSESKLAINPEDLTPEGLRFVGNRVIQNERAPKRDGALRMQTGFVPGTQGPQLRVRNAAHDTQSYSLNIDSDGRAAVLRRLAKAAGGAGKLGEFPLPKPLSAGEDYELELRAVGSQFTVKFNGQSLGEAEDTAIAEGSFGLATASTAPVLVLVKALDYLNLDGGAAPGKAASPKPPSQSGALGQSALPAALEARAIKLWDAPEKLPTSAKLRWEDQAVRVDGQPLREKAGVRDLVLRASVRLNPSAQIPQLHARVQSKSEGDATGAHYSLGISGDAKSVALIAIIGGKRKDLQTWPLPRPPGPDPWLGLELKIIGDALTVSADGRVLGTVRDTSVTTAGDVVIFANAGGYFRNISYIPLDGLSEAEARQAAGIKDLSHSPCLQVSRPRLPARQVGEGLYQGGGHRNERARKNRLCVARGLD